jgi:hypothetical protein
MQPFFVYRPRNTFPDQDGGCAHSLPRRFEEREVEQPLAFAKRFKDVIENI